MKLSKTAAEYLEESKAEMSSFWAAVSEHEREVGTLVLCAYLDGKGVGMDAAHSSRREATPRNLLTEARCIAAELYLTACDHLTPEQRERFFERLARFDAEDDLAPLYESAG